MGMPPDSQTAGPVVLFAVFEKTTLDRNDKNQYT